MQAVFDVECSVSPNQSTLIRNALALADRYFTEHGLGDAGRVTVVASVTPQHLIDRYAQRAGLSVHEAHKQWAEVGTAITCCDTIFVNLLDRGWQQATDAVRAHIVVHEVVHAGSSKVLLTTSARPVTCSLRSLETWKGMRTAGLEHSARLAYAAIAHLMAIPGVDLACLATFWTSIGQGAEWQPAFQQAFGRRPETFYTECEAGGLSESD